MNIFNPALNTSNKVLQTHTIKTRCDHRIRWKHWLFFFNGQKQSWVFYVIAFICFSKFSFCCFPKLMIPFKLFDKQNIKESNCHLNSLNELGFSFHSWVGLMRFMVCQGSYWIKIPLQLTFRSKLKSAMPVSFIVAKDDEHLRLLLKLPVLFKRLFWE